MEHNEIARRYTEITSAFKQNADMAHMVYSNANETYDKELADLQALCDHDAPPTDFIDGVSCPFCHMRKKGLRRKAGIIEEDAWTKEDEK